MTRWRSSLAKPAFRVDRRVSSTRMRASLRGRAPAAGLVLCLALALALASCAPATSTAASGVEGPLDELGRVALLAHHRMEIVYLETGAYTTNALIDLQLPRGVKWTLEDFSDEWYSLRFTDDAQPGVAWLVTPDGVTRSG